MATSSATDVVNQTEQVSPVLAKLAQAYGVATEYWDQSGSLRRISPETLVAVLRAFDVEADDDDACRSALAARRMDHWRRMLPPVFIMRENSEAITWVHVPHGSSVRVWIELENGGQRHDLIQVDNWTPPEMVDHTLTGEASFRLPGDLPVGWHVLHAESQGRRTHSPLAVAPDRLQLPESLVERAAWGLAVQLYSLRSERSWGMGDFADLADLAAWSGNEVGADFIQINPVHAGEPTVPMTPSPYLPVTRRFVNPIYIRPEAIMEFAYLSESDIADVRRLRDTVRTSNDSSAHIDRDATWTAKREALEIISKVPRSAGREADFQGFVVEQGEGLKAFATWCVLVELYGQDFNQWPEALQDPQSPDVAEIREQHQQRVWFFCWLQWVADEQLGEAQHVSKASGMRIGCLHDLAVGVHTKGADAWALHDVLAQGVSVGAPPDMFNQLGQDWTQPPWRPDTLADQAFQPFRDMLRTVLRHAGALRIDHILGLFRLWWIPDGMSPAQGTFVKFDHEALLNILVLEAHRANAVIIGEDLGTVEDWVQRILADRGILGTTILWFERYNGHIHPVEQWRWASMASVTVHDLPPTAGYLQGEHVRIRSELGLMTQTFTDAMSEHHNEIADWRAHLSERGLLRPDSSDEELVVALHRLLAQSHCRLLSVALPDTVGDTRPQNQPGTDREYPNWVIPLTDSTGNPVGIEQLGESELLRRLVAAVGG